VPYTIRSLAYQIVAAEPISTGENSAAKSYFRSEETSEPRGASVRSCPSQKYFVCFCRPPILIRKLNPSRKNSTLCYTDHKPSYSRLWENPTVEEFVNIFLNSGRKTLSPPYKLYTLVHLNCFKSSPVPFGVCSCLSPSMSIV
jgi:hypothetical protein